MAGGTKEIDFRKIKVKITEITICVWNVRLLMPQQRVTRNKKETDYRHKRNNYSCLSVVLT
jgi:hypothetical protein